MIALLSRLLRRRTRSVPIDTSLVPDTGSADPCLDSLAAQITPEASERIRATVLAATRGEYVSPNADAREAIDVALYRGGFRVLTYRRSDPIGTFTEALHEQGYVIVPSLPEPVDRWDELARSPGGTD